MNIRRISWWYYPIPHELTLVMMMMITIIVSVEQRPGWTEHVKVAFLKGPICIHMFVGQPVQVVVSFLSCQTRRPLSQPARLSSLLRTPQRGGSRERKCRFRQIFGGFFDSEKTCKNLQKPINFGEKPRVLSNFSLKLLTKWRIDNDCIYPLVTEHNYMENHHF